MKPADFGLLVAMCLFWALNLVITRWVVTVGDVPPLFFAAIRVTLLAAVLSPFLFPAPRQIGMMILIAMGMAGFQFGLLFLGLSTSTAGVASVMGQLGVPFTTILSIMFQGEKIGVYRTVGILLAFAGVVGLWGIGFYSYDLISSVLRKRFEAEGMSQVDISANLAFWTGIT
ncbi:MAG: DMT family transporter, partial [Hyphomonadaceae bacterium]